MKKLVAAAVACTLAVPAYAQNITGLNPAGHASLAWGADSARVSNHWREQPLAVKRENGIARLSFLPWLGMDTWTVAVHDRHGFVQAEAMSGAGVTGAACERQFRQFVALFQRSYRQLTPNVTERNDAGTGLCEAVSAGRGEARYRWSDPATGAETVVEVNRQGRVAFQTAAPQYRAWLAANAPAPAPVATAPQPAPAQPAAEPAAAPRPAQQRMGVTAAAFAAVRPGMTLEEVNTLIGSPGKLGSSSEFGGSRSEGYTWSGRNMSAIIVTFRNGRVAGGLQSGLYGQPSAGAAATLAKFSQLKEGMTLEEVSRIMGGPGNLSSFTDLGDGRMMLGYVWPGRSLGTTAITSFIDGRLMSQTQMGLR
jgi:hypothetical protein